MKRDERILQTAAEWFDRLRHAELAPEEVVSWQSWIAEDVRHRKAFDRLQDTWQKFEGVPVPLLASMQERMTDRYSGDVPVSQWIGRGSPASRLRRLWKPVGLAASLVFLAVMLGLYLQHQKAAEVSAFETNAAEHRDVRLPDGTRVSVGAKSLVWVRYQSTLREIVLDRGEAYFQVARDAHRPFIVRAGTASITAVGTAFNVRKSGARVQVVVAEGAVNVNPDAAAPSSSLTSTKPQTLQLRAGHQWIGDSTATDTAPITRATPESAASWRTGRLEYVGEPLKYVVADVNRYSKVEISIADPQLGELPVTGTVFEEDIDGWLESIEEFMPLRVERGNGNQIVLNRR